MTQSNINKSMIYLTLIFFFFSITFSLKHKQSSSIQQKEYNKLIDQQKSLQSNINQLVNNLQLIQKNISSSVKSSDKVFLLQSSIISQRQTIFNLQNEIIGPFSLSKTACLQLTNQQKINLLDKINTTRKQLFDLQKKLLQTQKCDKVQALSLDTQKQLTLLDSLQNTILTQCQTKTILTPTIYQTNIYADGWILGDQHIDDLIQEYYQRNIRYHNITNCPLQKPFFNGQQCIKCELPTPVFNILTKQCTICPQDQQPDPTKRICSYVPHYTNFSSVNNWAQQGSPMPVYKLKQVPCSFDKPYYNGKKCQSCLLPKYWSIKKNSCVECPKQMLFDVNEKKCQIPSTYDLTILQGTRWVTNDCNVTRVVQNRVETLKINQTKKYYKYCPSDKPYYDGIVCVSCPNQFNIDTRTCVSIPTKSYAYNQNMRCYLQKQSNLQTDPRASNYTTKYPLNDSPVPNCKSARPYYDGIACISCLDPFPIFNSDTRRCSACDPTQYYNNSQHKCISRQKIYISTNQNRLMGTSRMSLIDYEQQIRNKINKNNESIILLCNQTQYSNYIKCIDCKNQQYFNVESKICTVCDGTLNQTTKICMEKAYLYTNLNNNSIKRIVNMNNTVEVENKTINNNMVLHNNSKLCPVNTPYSTTSGCTNCTKQSFDYKLSKCVPFKCLDSSYPYYDQILDKCSSCPVGTRYDSVTLKCIPTKYVSNLNAIFFYIQQGNYTKKSLQDEQYELQKKYSLIPCDASHPYFNGTDCIDCAINRNKTDVANHKPYFNLRTKQCQNCKNYTQDTHKCMDIAITRQNCTNEQIFNQQTQQCITMVSNINTLSKSQLIQDGQGTLTNLNQSVTSIQKVSSTLTCPQETPLYSAAYKQCIRCEDPTPFYNLLNLACQSCDNYDPLLRKCHQELPRFKMNVEDFYGTIFG